ncbi:MAG: LysM peptidoglycan-binding domain-containing protein, partial [Myxococcaceae bacterium]
DTLGGIGAKFGVSYQAIASANGISNPNRIKAGQPLTIPGKAGPASTPAPASSSQRYTVRAGDTLGGIGAKFGVSYQAIASANGISNPNRIKAGQTLTIPGASSNQVSGTTSVAPVPGPVSGGVSVAQLRAIMPNLSASRAEQLLPHLNKAMVEGGITTKKRQAAFLAQLAHESVGLTAFEEFASGAAYEGRKDLGNVYRGDGVRYKGRGPIQLTGRANYRSAGKALGIDLENNPKRAADIDVGFRVAVWFWNSRSLSSYADRGDFDAITKRINGGYNGKTSRDAYHARAKAVLGV